MQNLGFALAVFEIVWSFVVLFFLTPNLKDITLAEVSSGSSHDSLSVTSPRPSWSELYSLESIFLQFCSQFFTPAEESTACIHLIFPFCCESSNVLSGQKLHFCQYSILLPTWVVFFLPLRLFIFYFFTYIYFRSFRSFMCDFTDKKKEKDFCVLPHGVPAPRWHCSHTMNDFVCAWAVASQGWQYRDEGLHSACLWLTWLRKTALGFAPRGRGSRHLDEKYSWSADFCRKTPVDKTQLWPTANSERKRGALKKKSTPEGCSQTYDEVDA